jgi:hypothetical protein
MMEYFKNLFSMHPELLVTILSGFLLPLFLVRMNYMYNLKSKDQEKQLEQAHSINLERINHEKVIHSSLVKILFEIQKLYISLSCDPVSEECVVSATRDFQSCFSKHQATISDNQIFLESNVINELYGFYNNVGKILIELNEINASGNREIAKVCVYNNSQLLADSILNIQEVFIKKRENLFGELKLLREEMKNFKTCCGPPPSVEQSAKYQEIMAKINSSAPVEPLITG